MFGSGSAMLQREPCRSSACLFGCFCNGWQNAQVHCYHGLMVTPSHCARVHNNHIQQFSCFHSTNFHPWYYYRISITQKLWTVSTLCVFLFWLLPCLILRGASPFLIQAATVASFSKMTIDDSRKLLPSDLYPSWVVFSSQQKVFGYL